MVLTSLSFGMYFKLIERKASKHSDIPSSANSHYTLPVRSTLTSCWTAGSQNNSTHSMK